MKKTLIAYYLLLITYCVGAQNLVPNYSFENKTGCPATWAELYLAPPWKSPTNGTPDYFNQCATLASLVDIPQNGAGFENALTGSAYTGIMVFNVFNSDWREYIQVALLDSLKSGQQYCVKFNISLADQSQYAINSLGIYFSKDSINNANFTVLPYSPQIKNSLSNMLNDTSGWTLISGILTATGGEKYLTIGNFNTDVNTDTLRINSSGTVAYYYIDDVSVIPYIEAEAGSSNDANICKGDSAILGAAATTDIIYQWQPAAGLSNSTIAQPMVSPEVTTTYVLTIIDTAGNYCIPKSTDTVTVIVNDCDSSSFIEMPLPNVFTPNGDGSNDAFKIKTKNIKEMKCEIYNRWGIKVNELIKPDEVWDGKTTVGLDCVDGVYYYILTATGLDGKEYNEKGFITLLK